MSTPTQSLADCLAFIDRELSERRGRVACLLASGAKGINHATAAQAVASLETIRGHIEKLQWLEEASMDLRGGREKVLRENLDFANRLAAACHVEPMAPARITLQPALL